MNLDEEVFYLSLFSWHSILNSSNTICCLFRKDGRRGACVCWGEAGMRSVQSPVKMKFCNLRFPELVIIIWEETESQDELDKALIPQWAHGRLFSSLSCACMHTHRHTHKHAHSRRCFLCGLPSAGFLWPWLPLFFSLHSTRSCLEGCFPRGSIQAGRRITIATWHESCPQRSEPSPASGLGPSGAI